MTESLTMGERIRRLRRKRGWTQYELAAEARVARNTLARWETDVTIPNVTRLFDLARALNVSMDYLGGQA